jgi:predicted phage baseplate assembly protein
MALPVPNLDDRRFQDFVDDAKRLISQRCPAWTDHNVSDPGVTLIELFAWMTDQLVYRLNRVPDRQYVTFLDLLGVQLFPPTTSAASSWHTPWKRFGKSILCLPTALKYTIPSTGSRQRSRCVPMTRPASKPFRTRHTKDVLPMPPRPITLSHR